MRPGTRLVIAALTLAAPVLTTFLAYSWHYDHPYADEWSFVPLIVKGADGTLTWHDLWVQFHEHRAVFLKLLMIGMARLSHWNLFWEVGVSLVATAATLALVGRQLRRLRQATGVEALAWALPLCSWLLFSPALWENWLFGLFMHNTLSVLLATFTFVLLCRRPLSPAALFGAIAVTVLATFTFIAGIFIWIAGSIVVLAMHRRAWVMVGWFLTGAVTVLVHFHDYFRDPNQGTSTVASLVIPFIVVFANPLQMTSGPALIVGLVAIPALPVLLVWLGRRRWLSAMGPLLGLLLYALTALASISFGRMSQWNFDFWSLMNMWLDNFWTIDFRSRYITYVNPIWFVMTAGLILCASAASSRTARTTSRMALGAVVILIVLNACRGFTQARMRHQEIAPVREQLVTVSDLDRIDTKDLLLVIGFQPPPDVFDSEIRRVREAGKILKARNWTVFRR